MSANGIRVERIIRSSYLQKEGSKGKLRTKRLKKVKKGKGIFGNAVVIKGLFHQTLREIKSIQVYLVLH